MATNDELRQAGAAPDAGLIARHATAVSASFLAWIARQARDSAIDHLLFLTPGCAPLVPLTSCASELGHHSFLPGSARAFLVAGTDHRTFEEQLPLLIRDFEGRSLAEVLGHLNAKVPDDHVLADLGFGSDVRLRRQDERQLRRFLLAYRRDILRAAQQARGAVFRALIHAGVRPGMNLAVVDLGWDGAAIEAFAHILPEMMEADISGFSFALVDAPDVRQRQSRLFLRGWVTRESAPALLAAAVADRDLLERALALPAAQGAPPAGDAEGTHAALADLLGLLTGPQREPVRRQLMSAPH